jgi:hypothetical protein
MGFIVMHENKGDLGNRESLEGLSYCIRDDGIHVFRFNDSRRETVDAWARISRENDLRYTASGEHLRTLFDVGEQWFTPYSLSTIVRMVNTTPKDLLESVAVMAGRNTLLSMVRSIVARLPQNPKQVISIFTAEEDAIRWLIARHQQLST